MVCEIAHFAYNGATMFTLIHRQLSALKLKSSPICSCTYYDEIHNSPCTSSTPLSHFYRGDADLSANVEPA